MGDDEADATLAAQCRRSDGVALPRCPPGLPRGRGDGPIPDGEAADAARFKEAFCTPWNSPRTGTGWLTWIGHWAMVETSGWCWLKKPYKGGLQVDLVVVRPGLAQVLDLVSSISSACLVYQAHSAQGIRFSSRSLAGMEVPAELIHNMILVRIAPHRRGGQAWSALMERYPPRRSSFIRW